jgi:hypothetical protein
MTPLLPVEQPKEVKPAPLIAVKVTIEDEKGITKEIAKEQSVHSKQKSRSSVGKSSIRT